MLLTSCIIFVLIVKESTAVIPPLHRSLKDTSVGVSDIQGVTGLAGRIYVLRSNKVVNIYNAETSELESNLTLNDLATPSDLTSSSKCDCLFVTDTNAKKVYKVKLDGTKTNWLTAPYYPTTISMARNKRNVLVTALSNLSTKRGYVLIEYNPNVRKNNMVRTITLPMSVQHVQVHHTIQLLQNLFAYSYGEESTARVCLLKVNKPNSNEIIVNSAEKSCYGGVDQSGNAVIGTPIYLERHADKSVVVADYNKSVVFALDSNLKERMNLTPDSMEWRPVRIAENENYLYVGEHQSTTATPESRVDVILVNFACPHHSTPCSRQGYCYNSGLCCMTDGCEFCMCLEGFGGRRCEEVQETDDIDFEEWKAGREWCAR